MYVDLILLQETGRVNHKKYYWMKVVAVSRITVGMNLTNRFKAEA